jgi:hypothetical protein
MTETKDIYWKLTANIDTLGSIGDHVAFTGIYSYSLIDDPGESFFPQATNVVDESRSGGGEMELGSRTIDMSQLGLFGLHFGNDWVYFQAGLMRSSFGPFFDHGAVLGPQAPAAGHFSFSFQPAEWLTLSSVYLDLYAAYKEDSATGTRIDIGKVVNKYFILHSFVFHPFNWWNLGVVQSVVAGNRFNPVYLVPIQHMFYTQQLYGDEDSSFLGLFSEFSLPLDFGIDLLVYVDDWDAFGGPSKSSKGINLNSAQNKFALQAGFTWSPSYRILRRLSLDYLMITPYTYTHSAHRDVDFLSYTHAGENLGSILDPNSDQITLSAYLTPTEWLDMDLWARFIRHGNASEGFTNGDGTIYDDGYTSTGDATFVAEPSRFLTQDTIEMVLQLGLELEFRFPQRWGSLGFEAGYILERVWNKDLVSGKNELNNFLSIGVGIRF